MTEQQLTDRQRKALWEAADDEARYPVTAGWAAANEVLAATDDTARAVAGDRTRFAWRPVVQQLLISALIAVVGSAVFSPFGSDGWAEQVLKLFVAASAALWFEAFLLRRRSSRIYSHFSR